ncbi:nucleoside 2-deoxyribosyltransferase [Herbaspirillum lusitanum]|uniref:Nucleoside 2-deoxyribosyltransferase n=1 Tax=Herbaspirillum lusitanum TaxID=213312 RepID=A0ABW9AFT7_9BURK
MTKRFPTVYMAGPDVFQPDYADYKLRLKQYCEQLGLTALCPGDDVVEGDSREAISQGIFELNMALIREADYIAANVANFRGCEPDSGTVFEIGYAVGLGKKVWCYNTPAIDLLAQVPQARPGFDQDGMLIEDFGLPRNLMIAHACTLVRGPVQACLEMIAHSHQQT